MKFEIKQPMFALESQIKGFETVFITEDEYTVLEGLAENGFLLTDHWLLLLERDKKREQTSYLVVPISTRVEILECYRDIITLFCKYKIKICIGDKIVVKIFDASVLTLQGLTQLCQYGMKGNESRYRYLQKYLANSACKAPVCSVHSTLGWRVIDGNMIFLSNEAVIPEGIDLKSQYAGLLDLNPKGSLEAWLKMIKEEVLENIPLTLSMIIGFSSIILGYLNHFMDIGYLLFALVGNSSSGKSTAAMLSASIWGNPSFDKGLITTMNATEQALVSFVSQADSHIVVLDEAATGDRNRFRRTLYQFCSGRGRMRLNTDGELKETHSFNTVILTTSEFPIVDDTAPNGIRARVFQISEPLTKSADNADRIKECVYQNYGHAGVKYANFIVKQKLESIMSDYNKAVKVLKKYHSDSLYSTGELTDRVLSKLAILLQTASYLDECFHFNLNKKIIDYLIKLEHSVTTEADIAEKALDCIAQYVARNNGRFLTSGSTGEYCAKIEGKIESGGFEKRVTILKEVVEQILRDSGFENPRSIYRLWQQKKLLLSEKDRPYKRVRLTSDLPPQPCFIIKI